VWVTESTELIGDPFADLVQIQSAFFVAICACRTTWANVTKFLEKRLVFLIIDRVDECNTLQQRGLERLREYVAVQGQPSGARNLDTIYRSDQ